MNEAKKKENIVAYKITTWKSDFSWDWVFILAFWKLQVNKISPEKLDVPGNELDWSENWQKS